VGRRRRRRRLKAEGMGGTNVARAWDDRSAGFHARVELAQSQRRLCTAKMAEVDGFGYRYLPVRSCMSIVGVLASRPTKITSIPQNG